MKKAVFFGATRGMGRALARKFAERGDRIFLLGTDESQLVRSAKDLEIRGASGNIGTAHCDLLATETFSSALDAAREKMQGFDTVVVTAALFGTQPQLEDDPQFAGKLLTADFTNTVLFCEEARKRLLAQGGGTLCVFSSVAGERGRKPVVLYGAAKAGLTTYLEGLDHKFRLGGLRTVCVKPGFVKTGMTAGLKAPPFAGTPDGVAEIVLRAIDRGKPVVFAPPIWRWIMFAIRKLPRTAMRRLEF